MKWDQKQIFAILITSLISCYMCYEISNFIIRNSAKTIIEMNLLIVIYPHTISGNVSDAEIDQLKEQLNASREFFWRNSHLTLHLRLNYLSIDKYLGLDQFANTTWGGFWLPPYNVDAYDYTFKSVERDLREMGIKDDQYASVLAFHAWNYSLIPAAYGGASLGIDLGFLGHTGYVNIPLCWDVSVWNWLFVHEFNHQLDSILGLNGYGSYPSSDLPWEISGDFGENFDYNAFFLRATSNKDWKKIANGHYGKIMRIIDNDQDSVPDSGNYPITEESFGSSPLKADTDQDGLNDLDELMAGIFKGSNPTKIDTDQDGLLDRDDQYPLYPINNTILKSPFDSDPLFRNNINWIFKSEGFRLTKLFYNISIGMSYEDHNLNLMIQFPESVEKIRMNFDLNNDGWFHGNDNVRITIFQNQSKDPYIQTLLSESKYIKEFNGPIWDDTSIYRKKYSPIFIPNQLIITRWSDTGYSCLKLKIPFDFQENKSIGFNCEIPSYYGYQPAYLFEENVLVDLNLGVI